MSRPRYWWYGHVRSLISRYPDRIDTDTVKGAEAYVCIKWAIGETLRSRDGPDKLRLLDMVCFRKTHELFGACMVLYISEPTGKRWLSEFVYAVARKMGYL